MSFSFDLALVFLTFFTIFFMSISIFLFSLYRKEKEKIKALTQENTNLLISSKTFEAEKLSLERFIDEQKQLKVEFKAIAEETLETTQSKWIVQAEKQFKEIHQGVQHDLEKKEMAFSHLVNPVKETLSKLDEKLSHFQKERHGSEEVLKSQLDKIAFQEAELSKETKALVAALKSSSVRGFWGEVTLKRIVELAGLVNNCDFFEQQSVGDEDRQRPDLVVRLPSQRHVVVDAKVPLSAYLQAYEETHVEQKKDLLEKHAKQIRSHIQLLSKKSYYEKFSLSPEFVVMFLPVDQIYQAALEVDPTLIEYSALNGVIIATPMSLIGLLKSVHYAWKQEAISINAKAISEQGQELSKSIHVFLEHLEKLGKTLSSSVAHYNAVLGSIESRLVPKTKKLKELLGQESNEVEPLVAIEKAIRNLDLETYSDSKD